MKVLIDTGHGPQDYTQYVVDGTLSLEDSINVPTLLTFTLGPSSDAFVVPRRSSYVTVVSERYASGGGYGTGKILATGFITNEPERQFLGLNPKLNNFNFQQLAYNIKVTSDEWQLNSRVVPYIPAFVNQTQGQILAGIAEALMPGFFDVTSFVGSGDIVPYYQYDPSQTWSDVAKNFGDSIRYRYKVINRVVYFQPFGDKPLGIQYDETQSQRMFFPLEMNTNVLTVPPVNDALVLGDIEPQDNWENYFVGDGFTSQFKLLHHVFDGATALLLQDDWTEPSFQSNLWNINVFGVADPTGGSIFQLAGALNVLMGVTSSTLGQTYILGANGIELGGGLNIQHGEFEFTDQCNSGILGGIYLNTNLTLPNCVAGFNLSTSGLLVTASGAGGIVIQPIYNGSLVGPQVVSQPNHHYTLQTWVGADRWDRYERIYRNLDGSITYGGNFLTASGTITWVITDLDQAAYAAPVPLNMTVQQYQASIIPLVTKYSVTDQNLPQFAVYSPVNAGNINLAAWYTSIFQPPEGSLYVRSLTGATGLQLPVLPPQLWTASTPPDKKLGPEIHYLMGFGQQNQTATVLANGDTQYLAFYTDTIPGVGSRIRYQSWAAGQSASKVRDPVAVSQEAVVSGDDGVRSAIFSNLNPQPRTSDECELAAAAAIHDREYPQFQGTYTVETVPYRFETLYNPGIYDYPISGRKLYINSPMRAVSGDIFIVNTARIEVVELRDEVLQIGLDYGPDLYLERLLKNFEQRSDKLLQPQETAPPLDFVHLAQVGNAFLSMLDAAKIINIQNDAVTGDTVTVDLGVAPAGWVCEVRRVDSGWGTQDQNLIGRFNTQVFTLPRFIRDQTWYLRQLNLGSGLFSRFSKVLRVLYPLVPSPPAFLHGSAALAVSSQNIALDFNGDIRDIYGVELRLPGVSGTYILNFPIGQPTGQVGSMVGPSEEINYLQRSPLSNDTAVLNSLALVPQNSNQSFTFQTGDIVNVQSPVNNSFNGLKVVTSVVAQIPVGITMVPNVYGNYVDSYFWPQNSGGGQFDTAGYGFPLNIAGTYTSPFGGTFTPGHRVGNSLLFNPVRMGQGVDPNTSLFQAVLGNNGQIQSYTSLTGLPGLRSGGLTHADYNQTIHFRLLVPTAGNHTITINHDDGMFFGIDNGATRISGPNTVFHANTAVQSLPVLGGVDQNGNYNDIYVINFPVTGTYNVEIDRFQWQNEQQCNVQIDGLDVLPGFLEEITWFDYAQPFPAMAGTVGIPFTNAGTVALQARNATVGLSSGSVTSGLVTLVTAASHGFNVGDAVCVGARVTPLASAGGSQDASYYTGQWIVQSVPASNQFTFPAAGAIPQNVGSQSLIGRASQLIANTSGVPLSGAQITVNTTGTLFQRPVFAPSDLIFDLTDPTIQNVLQVATQLNPSGVAVNAYFFNLTWDYSLPLPISVGVPSITGLVIDPVTQSAYWGVASGKATGYRVQTFDPVTGVLLNKYTIDHPHNLQLLTQDQLSPPDYYNARIYAVTPFNALGDGNTLVVNHNFGAATGNSNQAAYEIHATINAIVGSEQIFIRTPFDQGVTYAVDMVPSQAWIDVPPVSGQMICSLQHFSLANGGSPGTEFACLIFSPGSHVGQYIGPIAPEIFPVGDVIKVIAPTDTSNNGVGIGITLSGTLAFSNVGFSLPFQFGTG